MADWRPAKSIAEFIAQCDAAFPKRSKSADGTVGDSSHASRASGHNPNHLGVVCAVDITNDPGNGADCTVVAEQLRLSRDKRIVYVIWNRRIFDGNGGTSAWKWRDYHGADPHTGHVHMSVGPDVRPWTGGGNFSTYDDPAAWQLPVFGIGDDMADVMVPTSDNNPHHKPGTLLPLAEYLQELSHEIFAIRELTQKDLAVDKTQK